MFDPIDVFLLESPFRLDKELMNVTVRLICDPEMHVPDTLTRIRVLPTVAVVGQRDKVQRSDTGATLLDIYVKFLPKTGGVYDNLKLLGKMIKGLPGIQIIKYLTVGGKKVTIKGKPVVL
tara:strand:- start:2527 stop:2886 length:360 start_codon:yes stop_codon:yes gene_type:complete